MAHRDVTPRHATSRHATPRHVLSRPVLYQGRSSPKSFRKSPNIPATGARWANIESLAAYGPPGRHVTPRHVTPSGAARPLLQCLGYLSFVFRFCFSFFRAVLRKLASCAIYCGAIVVNSGWCMQVLMFDSSLARVFACLNPRYPWSRYHRAHQNARVSLGATVAVFGEMMILLWRTHAAVLPSHTQQTPKTPCFTRTPPQMTQNTPGYVHNTHLT